MTAHIRPDTDQAGNPGKRLRLERMADNEPLIELVEETTLPERVHRQDAHRADCHEVIILTPASARWLAMALLDLDTEGDIDLPEVDLASLSWDALLRYRQRVAKLGQLYATCAIVNRACTLRLAEIDRSIAVLNVRSTSTADQDHEAEMRRHIVAESVARHAIPILSPDRIEAIRADLTDGQREVLDDPPTTRGVRR